MKLKVHFFDGIFLKPEDDANGNGVPDSQEDASISPETLPPGYNDQYDDVDYSNTGYNSYEDSAQNHQEVMPPPTPTAAATSSATAFDFAAFAGFAQSAATSAVNGTVQATSVAVTVAPALEEAVAAISQEVWLQSGDQGNAQPIVVTYDPVETAAPTSQSFGQTYFAENPDVAAAFDPNTSDGLNNITAVAAMYPDMTVQDLIDNPDLLANAHYQLFGQNEQRPAEVPDTVPELNIPASYNQSGAVTAPAVGNESAGVNSTKEQQIEIGEIYLQQNPDVALNFSAATENGKQNLETIAAYLNIEINSDADYSKLTPDLIAEAHFALYGKSEGRQLTITQTTVDDIRTMAENYSDIHTVSGEEYLNANPDVAAAFDPNTAAGKNNLETIAAYYDIPVSELTNDLIGLAHFEMYGKFESRVSNPMFASKEDEERLDIFDNNFQMNDLSYLQSLPQDQKNKLYDPENKSEVASFFGVDEPTDAMLIFHHIAQTVGADSARVRGYLTSDHSSLSLEQRQLYAQNFKLDSQEYFEELSESDRARVQNTENLNRIAGLYHKDVGNLTNDEVAYADAIMNNRSDLLPRMSLSINHDDANTFKQAFYGSPIGTGFFGVGDNGRTGQDGVYEWLPQSVSARAQASTNGHYLLTSSDQVTTLGQHLDSSAVYAVIGTQRVEAGGEGSTVEQQTTTYLSRSEYVATLKEQGMSDNDISKALSQNELFLFSSEMPNYGDGTGSGGRIETYLPRQQYLNSIGLPSDAPLSMNVAFNSSWSGSGDAGLGKSFGSQPDLTANYYHQALNAYHAIPNDQLSSKFVQIGDAGPLGDDVEKMLDAMYSRVASAGGVEVTDELKDSVRSSIFHYDDRYGVLAPREFIEAAIERQDNRKQGFFEGPIGRAIISVALSCIPGGQAAALTIGGATVTTGAVLSAMATTVFAASDGADLGDALLAGAGSLFGSAAGNWAAGEMAQVLSVPTTAGLSPIEMLNGAANAPTAFSYAENFAIGATRSVVSSTTQQIITTGDININSLATSALSGGFNNSVGTAISNLDGVVDLANNLGVSAQTLGNATAAGLVGLATNQNVGVVAVNMIGSLAGDHIRQSPQNDTYDSMAASGMAEAQAYFTKDKTGSDATAAATTENSLNPESFNLFDDHEDPATAFNFTAQTPTNTQTPATGPVITLREQMNTLENNYANSEEARNIATVASPMTFREANAAWKDGGSSTYLHGYDSSGNPIMRAAFSDDDVNNRVAPLLQKFVQQNPNASEEALNEFRDSSKNLVRTQMYQNGEDGSATTRTIGSLSTATASQINIAAQNAMTPNQGTAESQRLNRSQNIPSSDTGPQVSNQNPYVTEYLRIQGNVADLPADQRLATMNAAYSGLAMQVETDSNAAVALAKVHQGFQISQQPPSEIAVRAQNLVAQANDRAAVLNAAGNNYTLSPEESAQSFASVGNVDPKHTGQGILSDQAFLGQLYQNATFGLSSQVSASVASANGGSYDDSLRQQQLERDALGILAPTASTTGTVAGTITGAAASFLIPGGAIAQVTSGTALAANQAHTEGKNILEASAENLALTGVAVAGLGAVRLVSNSARAVLAGSDDGVRVITNASDNASSAAADLPRLPDAPTPPAPTSTFRGPSWAREADSRVPATSAAVPDVPASAAPNVPTLIPTRVDYPANPTSGQQAGMGATPGRDYIPDDFDPMEGFSGAIQPNPQAGKVNNTPGGGVAIPTEVQSQIDLAYRQTLEVRPISSATQSQIDEALRIGEAAAATPGYVRVYHGGGQIADSILTPQGGIVSRQQMALDVLEEQMNYLITNKMEVAPDLITAIGESRAIVAAEKNKVFVTTDLATAQKYANELFATSPNPNGGVVYWTDVPASSLVSGHTLPSGTSSTSGVTRFDHEFAYNGPLSVNVLNQTPTTPTTGRQ